MRGTTEAFSFPSMRRLFRYLGETDALVELTELAARAFVESANLSGDVGAFVAAQSNKHGIRVNLSEFASSLTTPQPKLHRYSVPLGRAISP